MLDKLIYKEEPYTKTAFSASDFMKPALDIYFAFTDEPKTNPPVWHDTLKWAAGNGVEDAMMNILKMSNITPQDYDQKKHGRVDMEREGITVHGYIDAPYLPSIGSMEAIMDVPDEGFATFKGEDKFIPIEIKSINNANKWGVMEYENGNPRENYVGQLGVYMDYLDMNAGKLFVSSIDGLSKFCFEAKRGRVHSTQEVYVKCGNVEVNLTAEYKRWAKLWEENIQPKVMPDIFEYRYKYPLEEINWRELPASKISKARNGNAVIGDWQILYSPWKDKIIEMQGDHLGYNDEELAYIKEVTQGYTTWKKKK